MSKSTTSTRSGGPGPHSKAAATVGKLTANNRCTVFIQIKRKSSEAALIIIIVFSHHHTNLIYIIYTSKITVANPRGL